MKARRFDDGLLAIASIALIALVVFPPSRAALDALLSTSLAGGVVLLWLAIGMRLPLRWPLPRALTIFSLLRLGIVIAASQAILIDANAGHIIDTFGAFATSHGVLVGALSFTLVSAVHLAIITTSLQRVTDVAQRLSPAQAAQFVELPKLTRHEAIALIVIGLTTLAAGMAIGLEQHHLAPAQALHWYAVLAFGTAIAIQLPSILCAMAAGLLVTRIAGDGSTPGSAATA
jgi:type III secretion protein V